MSINEIQDEIIETFSEVDDWMDRYQLLIDLGTEQQPLPESDKTENNLIDGCQSRLWLVWEKKEGKLFFRAESDALIVKGIVALLIKAFNGHTPEEILNTELYFIDKIGLREHLSPTRSNGLLAMVKQMRMFALAFQASQGNWFYLSRDFCYITIKILLLRNRICVSTRNSNQASINWIHPSPIRLSIPLQTS